MANWINELKFDDKGLIPAVVQNKDTKEVLMVAYMNAQTLAQTVETKKATFWSRSRNEVWVKGATSGNYMYVDEIRVDCDGDCLVVFVTPAGAACHTGNRSCFYCGRSSACQHKICFSGMAERAFEIIGNFIAFINISAYRACPCAFFCLCHRLGFNITLVKTISTGCIFRKYLSIGKLTNKECVAT